MEILRAEERFLKELHHMGEDNFWSSLIKRLPHEEHWRELPSAQTADREAACVGARYTGVLQIAFARDEADRQRTLEALQQGGAGSKLAQQGEKDSRSVHRHPSDSSGDRSQTPSRREEESSRGDQTPWGKDEELGLEGLSQVCLAESENAKQLGSSEEHMSDSSGGSSNLNLGGDMEFPAMQREQHADSMRWRGGAGNMEEDKPENVSSGREGDTSSGSSRKRIMVQDKGSPGSVDELSSESPGKRSRGAPQRQKGGTLGDATVQSPGAELKHVPNNESSESVRQEDSDKQGQVWGLLSPSQKTDPPRLPGLGRYHAGEKDAHFGGWKKVLDGKKTIYECRFCEKRFTVSQALGGHMNRHRLERENEKELARATAHAKRDVQEKQASAKAQVPPVQSRSTPLNLSEAVWGASQSVETSPNLAPLPGSAIPSLQTELGKVALSGNLPPVLQPGGLGTYEAGFEAGFGAGLVALARAGLLVPDAMVALGWQGASEKEQMFVQTPAVQGQTGLQMKAGPSEISAPDPFDAELSLGLKARIDGMEAPTGRLPAVGSSPPAVMPVWVDTPRGQQQVFQVEGVKGLDKGLYALRPYKGQPDEESLLAGGVDFSRMNGGGESKAERFAFEAEVKRDGEEKGLSYNAVRQQQELACFAGHVDVSRPAGPAVLRHTLAHHDLSARGNSPGKLSVGFRAALPSTLPVNNCGVSATKGGVFKFSRPHQAEISARFRAVNRDAETIDASSEEDCKPILRPQSTQELPRRQASLSQGGLFGPSPALVASLQPTLSLTRQPSDLISELLQSQPSLFGPSLGNACLSGTFDVSLGNFAQDHPDWPDYFQGGSVNGGDAFSNPETS